MAKDNNQGKVDLIKTCAEDIGRDVWFKLREHGIIAHMAKAGDTETYSIIEGSARILSLAKRGSPVYNEAKGIILNYVGKLAARATSHIREITDRGFDVACDILPHPISAYQGLTKILGQPGEY